MRFNTCILSFFIIILLGSSSTAIAQKFNAKQTFINAQKFLQLGETQSALLELIKYYQHDSTNQHVNFLIGECYFKLDETRLSAITFLEKASDISPKFAAGSYKERKSSPLVNYYLGKSYFQNYRFEEALSAYQKYLEYVANDPAKKAELEDLIRVTKNAVDLSSVPVKINIINLGPKINSEYDDHSPVFNIDETVMVFTSKRKGSTGGFKTTDKQYFEDIYVVRKNGTEWGIAEKIGETVNSSEHEASVALSADGNELIIYKDDLGDGNLYMSKYDGTTWSKPEKLGSNINSTFDESHASISPDGNTLYFSSNRAGGKGGYDLYSVKRLPNGEWGLAENLGDVVNTAKDESGPFIHQDGSTLYFSSKGFNSMGGYDLFFTILKDDGTYSLPENMGYPLNSIEDDIFYVLSADGKRAYYSSERSEGLGRRDIYLIDLLSLPERSLIVITGFIRKKTDKEVLKDIQLVISDAKTGARIGKFKPNPTSGKYTLVVPKSKQYTLSCDECTYTFPDEPLTIPENSSFYYLQRPITMDPIVVVE